jgi:formate--tetrahydrofolate ligase
MEADPEVAQLGICMAKTHLSLTDNPMLKGAPKGWRLNIQEVLTFKGAGFIVPFAGTVKVMPGTCSDPAFRRVDVDVETGRVKGLF